MKKGEGRREERGVMEGWTPRDMLKKRENDDERKMILRERDDVEREMMLRERDDVERER